MPLKQVFQDFKRSKERLRSIHEETIECFKEIARKLSANANDAPIAAELTQTTLRSPSSSTADLPLEDIELSLDDVQITVNLAEELYTPKEREQVCSLFSQDPALIFVGQTNCGKSSIINELLGGNQKLKLPTSDEPSTARIVRVRYGEKPGLKIQTKDGKILKECDLTGKKKIPRKEIELRQKQRQSAEFVQSTAIVELNNEFLKSGIDIIDSPGWNENEALDNLVKEQLENSLPLIIYVIDGHNLFTIQDRDVLSDIVAQRQGLEIFYVVNKLEPEDRECSDDEEPMTAQQVLSIQESKKRRVYERLLANGFLSKASGKSMNKHEHFHGLSAWKIREYNKQKDVNAGPGSDASLSEYMEAFIRFQNCMQAFAEGCLRVRLDRACQILINVLSRCLDFFIQKANDFRERKEQMLRLIKKVLAEESSLNERIAADLEARTPEIEGALSETFIEVREEILEEARTFEFNSVEGFVIAQDKRVTSSSVIENCRQQLGKMAANKLQDEIQSKLAMLFQSRDVLLLRMTERIQKIEEEMSTDGFVPAAVSILTKSLVSNYNQSSIPLASDRDGAIVRFFKWFLSSLLSLCREPLKTAKKTFARGYKEIRMQVAVGSSEWKEDVVSKMLDAIDSTRLATEILNRFKIHLQECHNDFTEDMENIQNLLRRGGTVKDEQRKKIMEFAPSLAKQEMFAYSVLDRFRYGLPKKGTAIGRGAQAVVHVCENILTSEGNPCVVKTVDVPMAEMLDNVTIELHNARILRHANIMPLVCAIIDENFHDGSPIVFVVSERMKCDLAQALPSIASLRSRLMIAVDVAKALQYLHQANLMHRDVKLQNVLLDDRNRAKLADFGLSKPEGLANNSLVGTVPYMAPEMLTQYNKSVDVYAFGMMLWRLCEGKGNNPKNTYQDSWPFAMLIKNAEAQLTPERLEVFPLGCWELMEQCWQLDSDRRPSFDSILQKLESVLQDENIL